MKNCVVHVKPTIRVNEWMKLRNRYDHDGDDDEEVEEEEEEEEEEEKTYSPIPSKQASLHVCPLSVLTPRYRGWDVEVM